MPRKGALARGLVWLALAALCMAGGISVKNAALPDTLGRVACRYGGDGPSFEAVKTLREKMADSALDGKAEGMVTAWAQEQKAQITNAKLNASTVADVLWVDGATRLIWPWKEVQGSLPVLGNARDCAIDAQTACYLFGSTDVLGLKLEVNEVEYEIACVFELPDGLAAWTADPGYGLLLCPAAPLADPPPLQALDFTVFPRDAQQPKEWITAWLNSSAMPQPLWADALWQRQSLLSLAAACGPCLLALFILWALGKAIWRLIQATAGEATACLRNRSLPASRGFQVWVIGLVGAGLLGALVYLAASLAGFSPNIPPDYLPSRWSDLSFWPTLLSDAANGYAARRMTGALRPDMVYAHLCRLSALLSLFSVPLLGLARVRLRRLSPGQSWRKVAALLCGMAMVPLALWSVRRMGFPPAAPTGLLPLVVLFIAVALFVEGYPPAEQLIIYLHKEVSQ